MLEVNLVTKEFKEVEERLRKSPQQTLKGSNLCLTIKMEFLNDKQQIVQLYSATH